MRLVVLFVGIFVVCSTTSQSKTSLSDRDDLDPESYRLYSEIYSDLKGFASDETLGFAAKPLPYPPAEGCLKPSNDEERKMAEAVKASGPNPSEWQMRFDLKNTYFLIPDAEVNKAIDCIGKSQPGSQASGCGDYSKLHYVRFLSQPVFNKDHTRALIAISRSCGGLCGNGSYQVWHKVRGRWALEQNSFAKCYWES